MDLHRKLLIFLLIVLRSFSEAGAQTGTINVDQNHTGHKIYGLPTPVADNEAATKKYVDDNAGGGGATNFLDLTDTPNSYSGQTLKAVRVNAAENALEFYTPGAGTVAWGAITGTLSAQTDLQTALDGKQPIDADLTALAALSGTHDIYYRSAANTWSPVTIGSGLDFTGATLSATGGVTPAALTRTNDTNVTLTLGGTPTTALLQATSLTLGWSGTLAVSRGGIGAATAAAHNYFGNNTGSTAAPDFHQIDYAELTGTPTVPGEIFKTIAVSGQSDVVADTATDTLTLAAGSNITLTTNAGTDTVTIAAAGGGASVANPGSQLLGLTAINGSASTALRSDGAPALSQAIVPTWTGLHAWKVEDATTAGGTDVLVIGHNSSGTPVANFGEGIKFQLNSDTTDDRDSARINVRWTNPADGARTSSVLIQGVVSANALDTIGRFSGGGGLSVGKGTTADSLDGVINAETGYTVVHAASTSGKMMQSNGTVFTASTPTWPTTVGTAGYEIMSNGTNFVSYPTSIFNSSVSSQTPSTSDVYLAGSNVVVSNGDWKAKGQYRCVFDVVKSAGTGGIVITLRIGTNGTTADTSRITWTFSAGTSVADTGTFEVIVNWRTVGSGTTAVVSGLCRAQKNTVTAAGLWNTTSAAFTIVGAVSGGFDSTGANNMGLSFNGGTAFAGTITTVQATLNQP